MHCAYNSDFAAHTTHRTTPAHFPHQSALHRMCHLQRRITTLMSGRTPVPGSALHPSPQRALAKSDLSHIYVQRLQVGLCPLAECFEYGPQRRAARGETNSVVASGRPRVYAFD